MRGVVALALLALLLRGGMATGQELVHFPSLEDRWAWAGLDVLDGYLFRAPCGPPAGDCRAARMQRFARVAQPARSRRAIACGPPGTEPARLYGFAGRQPGAARPWRDVLDCGLRPGNLPQTGNGRLWRAVVFAGATFVRGDRIALVGWSQGGGVALSAIGSQGLGRPSQLPQGDYRAAIAFCPGQCDPSRRPAAWTSSIPLLVLLGAEDVWTPAAPCEALLTGAATRRPNRDAGLIRAPITV